MYVIKNSNEKKEKKTLKNGEFKNANDKLTHTRKKDTNKGITLVALVVTIIILLILAGITINSLTNSGLFDKVKEAKEKYKNAQELENSLLANYEDKMNEYVGSGRETYGQVISGPVAGGSYSNPYIPTGFTHTVGDGTWNSGYTIKNTSNGDEFVWVPCIVDDEATDTVLDQSNGDKVVKFGKTLTGKYLGNVSSVSDEGDEASPDSNARETAIKTSVEMYQGFYIAKYEAGVPYENGTQLDPTAISDYTKKARSVANATVWTNITRTNALVAAKSMYNNSDAKTGLISGACWDTTLQWMVNASDNRANQPNLNYDTNSTGKGFYSNSNTKQIAGTTNVVNNIYNMAGNVWEWTSERNSNGTYLLVLRGRCLLRFRLGLPSCIP